jgi:hypothetical protein
MDFLGFGTAHLLPRLIRGRQAGPVSLSERRPSPGCRPAAKDLCPVTGRARLGYDRARILFTRYTGWKLHHCATPRPPSCERGIPLQLIMAKTRHRNPRTAMRYVRPGAEAVAEITALLEPPRRRGPTVSAHLADGYKPLFSVARYEHRTSPGDLYTVTEAARSAKLGDLLKSETPFCDKFDADIELCATMAEQPRSSSR